MLWVNLFNILVFTISCCIVRVMSGGVELPYKRGMRMGRSYRLVNGKMGSDLFPESELAQNMIVQRLDRLKVKINIVKKFESIKKTLGIHGIKPDDKTDGAESVEGPGKEYLQRRPIFRNPKVLEILVNLEYHLWVESLGKDAILHFPMDDRRTVGQYYVDSLTHGGQLVISFIWHLKNGVNMMKIERSARDLINKNKNSEGLDFLVQLKESLRQETRMIMINSFVSKGIKRPLVHFDNIQRVVELFKTEVSKMNEGRGIPMRATLRKMPELAIGNQRVTSKHRYRKEEDEIESISEVIKKNVKPADLISVESFYKDLRDAQVTFVSLVRTLNKTEGVKSGGKSNIAWNYDKEIQWITKEKKLLSEEIRSLKKEFLDVKNQLDQYTNKDGSEFEPEVIQQLYSMMKKLTEIEKDLKQQRGKCKKLVPKQWFTASLSSAWDTEGETIVYDVVINNHGNMYDNITGVITAPEHGLYAITYVVPFMNNSQPIIEMKKSRSRYKSKGKDKQQNLEETGNKKFPDKDQSDDSLIHSRRRIPRSVGFWDGKKMVSPRQRKSSVARWRESLQSDRKKKSNSKNPLKVRSRRNKSRRSRRKRNSRNSRSRSRKSRSSKSRSSRSRRKNRKRNKFVKEKTRQNKKRKSSRKSHRNKVIDVDPIKVVKQPLIINVDGSKQQKEGESSRNSVLLVLSEGDKVWMELVAGILESTSEAAGTLSAVLLRIEEVD